MRSSPLQSSPRLQGRTIEFNRLDVLKRASRRTDQHDIISSASLWAHFHVMFMYFAYHFTVLRVKVIVTISALFTA